MRRLFHRLVLQLKSIGLLWMVPLVVLNLVFPLMLLGAYQQAKDLETFRGYLAYYGLMLLPLFSVWHVQFTIREYLEADGNELLFTTGQKIRLGSAGMLFSLYALNVIAIYGGLCLFDGRMMIEALNLLSVCLLYFGISYLLLFLTGSMTVTLLTTLFYTLIAMLNMTKEPNAFLYVINIPATWQSLADVAPPRVIVGALLTVFGILLNCRYAKFR